MAELKGQEERLKFLISRIDSEIEKFQKHMKIIEEKQSDIHSAIGKRGIQEVPIEISPHSDDSTNLYDEIRQHLLDLNKLKNLISKKLDIVIKEEELIKELRGEYGNSIGLKRLESGEFEISYSDEDTEKAFSQIRMSKKLIDQLKKSVQEAAGRSKENEAD